MFNITSLHTNFAQFVTLLCMTWKFQFSYLYFYTPLSAQKLWVTFPCMLSMKKVHPQNICMACTHAHTHTHTTNMLQITYQNCIEIYLKFNFWIFAIKHLLRTIVSTDQYFFWIVKSRLPPNINLIKNLPLNISKLKINF